MKKANIQEMFRSFLMNFQWTFNSIWFALGNLSSCFNPKLFHFFLLSMQRPNGSITFGATFAFTAALFPRFNVGAICRPWIWIIFSYAFGKSTSTSTNVRSSTTVSGTLATANVPTATEFCSVESELMAKSIAATIISRFSFRCRICQFAKWTNATIGATIAVVWIPVANHTVYIITCADEFIIIRFVVIAWSTCEKFRTFQPISHAKSSVERTTSITADDNNKSLAPLTELTMLYRIHYDYVLNKWLLQHTHKYYDWKEKTKKEFLTLSKIDFINFQTFIYLISFRVSQFLLFAYEARRGSQEERQK